MVAAAALRFTDPASEVIAQPQSTVSFRKIDIHNHLGRAGQSGGTWRVSHPDRLVATMDACMVEAMVNLDGYWGEELEANLSRYDRRYPDRFLTFCRLDWSALSAKNPSDTLVKGLKDSFTRGARGVKIWKDLGLSVRDGHGQLVLPNDPRLSPLWETAGEAGVPVLIHTADPVAFFRRTDARNERLEQLLTHPEWSQYRRGVRHHFRLREALEEVVADNPGTNFIGAHGGCFPEDLDWVAQMLVHHPHFHIDLSARVEEFGRQPVRMRDLVLMCPDQVLYGTDSTPPNRLVTDVYDRFLQTRDEHFPYADRPRQGRWTISGIGLPKDVLEKLYFGNAFRLVFGSGRHGESAARKRDSP